MLVLIVLLGILAIQAAQFMLNLYVQIERNFASRQAQFHYRRNPYANNIWENEAERLRGQIIEEEIQRHQGNR